MSAQMLSSSRSTRACLVRVQVLYAPVVMDGREAASDEDCLSDGDGPGGSGHRQLSRQRGLRREARKKDA
jgi:hypothetical protein